MTIRVLQFGTTGQLAAELIRQAEAHPVELTALSRVEADFDDAEQVARVVWARKPDLVINAAAYTAVDQAEADVETAFEVNAQSPAAIAAVCGASGPAMVHVSTDYVFDGEADEPYRETDPTNPLSAYGRSKLSGEQLVLAACPRALVLRTSWVVSAHGRNFVKTVLRLAAEAGPLRIVDDQFGRPTSAADLAGFVLAQAAGLAAAPTGDPRFGLVHFANAGEVSWRGFAEAIVQAALGAAAPPVAGIATADYPTAAVRPQRGTLDTSKLEAVFGYTPRPWRAALAEIVAELKVSA